MQSQHHGHGLINNVAAQMTLAGVAVVVLVVVAWIYVW
jgi:hypothetical protein